ncbi:MAG TPA: hypothetical protein VKQ36_04570, partial [Ktedonobacterales bacterium]|nr:hypothetical protein [Ktedonobacterales bacterium]
ATRASAVSVASAPVADGFSGPLPGEAPPLRMDQLDHLDRRASETLDDLADDRADDLGPMPTGRYSGQRLMARVEATK